MSKIPQLNHKILENLFLKRTLSEVEINDILSLEKNTLTQDLIVIINFCNNEFDDIEDDISYNLLIYTLFLLKENENRNQLNILLDILKWSDDKIEYWFRDYFTEYFWNFIYHFGQQKIETLVGFLKEEDIRTFSKEEVALALYQIYLKHEDQAELISNYWTELLEFYNNNLEESSVIDYTYLAFFVSYIAKPNKYQKQLIEHLYDKYYIDISVNGSFEELFDFIEPVRKDTTVFDLNTELIEIENRSHKDYNSTIFEDFGQFKKNHPIISEKKPGRNDICLCGSGKKYKKCCID